MERIGGATVEEGKMAGVGRTTSSSLGGSIGGGSVSRRRSWQGETNRSISTPATARSMPVSPMPVDTAPKTKKRSFRFKCTTRMMRRTALTILLLVAAAILTAIIVVAVLHPESTSAYIITAENGATAVIARVPAEWVPVVAGALSGALLAIIASYALYSYISSRRNAGMEELTDVEVGGEVTANSIVGFLSDSERKLVEQYQLQGKQGAATAGSKKGAEYEGITIHRLPDDVPETRDKASPARSWSIKRLLSFGRDSPDNHAAMLAGIRGKMARMESSGRMASSFDGEKQQNWQSSSDLANTLSGPDAFHRASKGLIASSGEGMTLAAMRSSSAPEPMMGDYMSPNQAGEEEAEGDPERPTTPSFGDLAPFRREPAEPPLPDDMASAGSPPQPRIVVRRSQEAFPDLFDEENASEMDAMDIAAHRSVPMRKAPPPKTSLEEAGSSPGLQCRASSLGSGSDSSESAAWQDVGLDSEDEGQHNPGRSRAASISSHAEGEASAGVKHMGTPLELMPFDALPAEHGEVRLVVVMTMEEVLPRPQAGLLNRMLRLANVPLRALPGVPGPAFSVKPGWEYMVGFRVLQPPHPVAAPLTVNALRWLRVQPAGGQTVRFVVEEEPSQQPGWYGTTCWETALHTQSVVGDAEVGEASTEEVCMTLGLEVEEHRTHKLEARIPLSVCIDRRTGTARFSTGLYGLDYSDAAEARGLLQEWGLDMQAAGSPKAVFLML